MYRVEWNDYEGNLQEMSFDKLRDANREADDLKERFDYVAVFKEPKR